LGAQKKVGARLKRTSRIYFEVTHKKNLSLNIIQKIKNRLFFAFFLEKLSGGNAACQNQLFIFLSAVKLLIENVMFSSAAFI
jgi:hypothetical protein